MVFNKLFTNYCTQGICGFNQPAIAFPCLRVKQLLFLFFWQPFFTAALFIITRFVIIAPINKALVKLWLNPAEAGKEIVTKLFVKCGANLFVTRGKAQTLYGFDGELTVEPKRALNRYFPVAELFIEENSGFRTLFKIKKGVENSVNIFLREFAVLFAEIFAKRLEPLGGIDKLKMALTVCRLAVGKHPDVGGDTGVVKEVERKGNNGFDPVVFDEPAADIAFALSGVTSKEGTAVMDFSDATAEQ